MRSPAGAAFLLSPGKVSPPWLTQGNLQGRFEAGAVACIWARALLASASLRNPKQGNCSGAVCRCLRTKQASTVSSWEISKKQLRCNRAVTMNVSLGARCCLEVSLGNAPVHFPEQRLEQIQTASGKQSPLSFSMNCAHSSLNAF